MDLCNLITSYLHNFSSRRPEIAIHPSWEKGGMPDEAFHRLLKSEKSNSYVSGELRRIMLLDPVLYDMTGQEFYFAYFERMVAYLSNHPVKPLEYPFYSLKKEDIPSHYNRLLGLTRASGTEFIDALCQLYWQGTQQDIPESYRALGITPYVTKPIKNPI